MIVKLLTIGVSKLKRRLQTLIRVYTFQKATLLEISCTGSFNKFNKSCAPKLDPQKYLRVSSRFDIPLLEVSFLDFGS